MAISNKSRAVLLSSLTQLTNDEGAVEEMLANFPARDMDEPASKEFIDSRISNLEVGLEARFAQIDGRFAAIDVRFAQVDGRFDAIDVRFVQVDGRFDAIDVRFAQVDARFAEAEARADARHAEADARTDAKFSKMETRMAEAETRMMTYIHSEIRSSMRWTIAMVFSLAVVLVGAMAQFA
jgi:hypothetical protein